MKRIQAEMKDAQLALHYGLISKAEYLAKIAKLEREMMGVDSR